MAQTAGLTSTKNLLIPEVLKELLEADLEMKYIHAHLKFGKIATIDTTLQGVAGDSVTVMAYNYIGAAEDVAEGELITATQLTASKTVSPKIKKAAKSTALTDEAAEITYGDPAKVLKEQIQLSISHKMDNDILTCLETAPLAYDDLANTDGAGATKAPIRYSSVLNAVGLFEDEDAEKYALYAHPRQRIDLLRDETFEKVSEITKDVMFFDGAIGRIADCDVVLSKRVPTVKVGGAGADKDDVASYVNFIVKPDAVKVLTKRGMKIETERQPERSQTAVYVTALYTCWLEFGDRVVKLLSPAGYGVKNVEPTHLLGLTPIVNA